jgi:hypothetical protein
LRQVEKTGTDLRPEFLSEDCIFDNFVVAVVVSRTTSTEEPRLGGAVVLIVTRDA